MKFEDIKNNEEIKTYIKTADEYLEKIGYTEHSFSHVLKVASMVEYILKELGYDQHTIELGKIAGYMHDIGNVINREHHAQSGALMAFRILDNLGMDARDISNVVLAIGNHDESSAFPVSHISSALILADKTDVRRSRVRIGDYEYDIHDRVNFAVINSSVNINKEEGTFNLNLSIDTSICSIVEYFEIFLSRMNLCKKAAKYFNLEFKLIINDQIMM